MAIDITIKNTLDGFKVVHAKDLELKKKLEIGKMYKARITVPRNLAFHNKYFALLGIVLDNLPHDFKIVTATGQELEVKTIDSLLWHIKMQTGHYTEKVTLGGRVTFEADSISWAKMDNAAFQDFYSASIDVILKYFLVGVNRAELEETVIMEFG